MIPIRPIKVKRKKDKYCNVLDCYKKVQGRGCCTNHYALCFFRIKKGHTTDQNLVSQGIFNPLKKSSGRKVYPSGYVLNEVDRILPESYADYLKLEKERINKKNK